MHRSLVVLLLAGILSVGFVGVQDVGAATLRGGQNYTLPQGATLAGDLYVAGSAIVFSGTTTGDAILLGATVDAQAESTVQGDLFFAAGSAVVSGVVLGDVRGAVGELTFRGSTTEDAVLAGGTVLIEPGARIGGDLIVFAERLVVKGVVDGTLDVHAQTVEIDGVVRGSVSVVAGNSVSLRDAARVGGDFTYSAPRAAFVTDAAQVSGTTTYSERAVEGPSVASAVSGFTLWFIVSLAGSALLFAMVRRRVVESVQAAVTESTNVLLWGLGALVLLPLGSLFVLLTFVGIFVGLLGLLAWGVLLIVGLLLGPIIAGTLTAVLITKRREVTFAWIAVGAAVLELVGAVPIVGFLIGLMVLVLGMGVTARTLYRALSEQPPEAGGTDATARTEGDAPNDREQPQETPTTHEREETG